MWRPKAERGEDRVLSDPQSPVGAPDWPSDTPVLCQQSGGKPGVTFTSAKGEVFSVLEEAPGQSVSQAWFILLRKVLHVGYGQLSASPESLSESLSIVSGFIKCFLSVRHSVEGRCRRQGL